MSTTDTPLRDTDAEVEVRMPEDWAAFTRRAMTWPSLSDIRRQYGVTDDFIRGAVAAGVVECIRLERMRINPESWEKFLASRYSPRTR